MGPLVDTSVLVDYFGGTENDETRVLDSLFAHGLSPATTPIVVQELLQGFRSRRHLEIARRDLSLFTQLPAPGYAVHEHAAQLHRELRAAGMTATTIDALIVAVALEAGCDLLTRDAMQKRLAEFAGVPLA